MGDSKTIMWHQSEAEMAEYWILKLKAEFLEELLENVQCNLSKEYAEKWEAIKKKIAVHTKEYEELYEKYGNEWIE